MLFMLKKRTNITASSLASYFGVGFNTPEDQLLIDLGEKEVLFSDEAQRRLDYGNFFEDPMLDWFEQDLGIIISDRNTEVVTALDGMLRVKVDGMTTFEGEPTVIEAKFSNAKAGSFLDNKGYHLQLKAGMVAKGVRQGLLLGMYQGLPQYVLIKITDADVQLIEDMCVRIGAILQGISDRSDFPFDLVEQYKSTPVMEGDEFVEFDEEEDTDVLKIYLEAKAVEKEAKEQVTIAQKYLLEKYPLTKFDNEEFKISVTNRERAGALDYEQLRSDFPHIDFDAYRKEPTVFKTLIVSKV